MPFAFRTRNRFADRPDDIIEVDIANEVAMLQCLSIGQLRQHFAEVFGEATRAGNKIWLLAQQIYGFSDEELDFILNYDIK